MGHWPAKIGGGRLVDEPGHVIDLMPTLLDIAGADYPQEFQGKQIQPMEGRSLKPQLLGARAETSPRPIFWEHQGNKAVRIGNFKAVASGRGPWELYDLSRDRC